MIPTKMLVYRGPDERTHSETIPSTRRRKKSTGELFQKGYRVRMGHGHVGEKEDQDSIWYSLGACFHVISYWGKTCRTRERGGISAKAEHWRVPEASGLSVCISWSRFSFRICSVLCSPSGKRSLEIKKKEKKKELWRGTPQFTSFYKR